MLNKIKYSVFALLNVAFAVNAFSQTTTTTATSDFNISINATLCSIAIMLLFIIIILTRTVYQAIELYKYKDENTKNDNIIKPITILIGFLMLSQYSFAQATQDAAVVVDNSAQQLSTIYFYSFIVVIIIEVAIIFFLLKSIRFLTGIEKQQQLKVKTEDSFWFKLNKLKPIEEEDSIDTGHSYDGIRELDNITPPWFTISFLATIVFAIVYLYRYEVAHTAPDQLEEFETEMRSAKLVQDSLLKLEGNNIDENTVVLLSGADVDAGKGLYMSNCSACHGDKGQGGVGPNFADEYWIHGGSLSDVFKSIKYGWQDKGMKPWKDDFSPKQIAQLTSYIESFKGTNPPNAKEKQGELYVEKTAGIIVDSIKTEIVQK